jgi:hypothetical protein
MRCRQNSYIAHLSAGRWAFVGCGRAADQPRTCGPCKPQIATDSYSIGRRNPRRPVLTFDNVQVLPTQRFQIMPQMQIKSYHIDQKGGREAGVAVKSRVEVEKRSRARGVLQDHIGHGQRSFHGGARRPLYIFEIQASLIKAFRLYG